MRPLPPQAKGVEQLVVGALYDLADGGHPSPQMLGAGLERVSFGRMDDARPVALSPAAVVLGSFETFVGYVGSRGDRSYTGKASVRLSPHSKESLGHLLVGGRGGSKAQTRDDSSGICSGEQRKAFVPSPRLLDHPMSACPASHPCPVRLQSRVGIAELSSAS